MNDQAPGQRSRRENARVGQARPTVPTAPAPPLPVRIPRSLLNAGRPTNLSSVRRPDVALAPFPRGDRTRGDERSRRVIRAVARVPTNIAEHVGRTPMVQLTRICSEPVELFAKLEAFNPGGSVKDRIGVSMIEAAEREGR